MLTGGGGHSQLGRGDCDDGEIIRCETLCPPLPRRTLRFDEAGARTFVVGYQRGCSTADGEELVTRLAAHGTSADRQFSQHLMSPLSQLRLLSPSEAFYRFLSDGRGEVAATMTEQLSTLRSEQVGGAAGRIHDPRNSSGGQRDEPGRHVTIGRYTFIRLSKGFCIDTSCHFALKFTVSVWRKESSARSAFLEPNANSEF